MIPVLGTFQDSFLQIKFLSLPLGCAKVIFRVLDIKRKKKSSYFQILESIAWFKSVKTCLKILFSQEELVR